MYRSLCLVLIALVFFGCSVENPVKEVRTNEPTAPGPLPSPTPDVRLSTPELQAEWNQSVNQALQDASQARESTQEILSAIGSINMPDMTYEMVFQFLREENFSEFDPPEMTASKDSMRKAKSLEEEDEEWRAGKMFYRLKDFESVKRCALALQDESEWEAAAQLYVLVEDLVGLRRCINEMLSADWQTRSKSVARFALEEGFPDTAEFLLDEYEWELRDLFDNSEWAEQCRKMAEAGHSKYLLELINEQIADWEAGYPRYTSRSILKNLVSASNAESAYRYLRIPGANTAFEITCGEGGGVHPLDGLDDFFTFTGNDPELRKLFLQRTEQLVDDIRAAEQYSRAQRMHPLKDLSEPEYVTIGVECKFWDDWGFWKWLYGLRESHPELRAIWTEHIKSFRDDSPLLYEKGLWVLTGRTPEPRSELEMHDRTEIALIAGVPLSNVISVDELAVTAYSYSFDERNLYFMLSHGEFTREHAFKLWEHYDLSTPTPVDEPVYTDDENVKAAIELARSMHRSDQESTRIRIITDLAQSGYLDRIPDYMRDVGSVPCIYAENGELGPMTKVLISLLIRDIGEQRRRFYRAMNEATELLKVPLKATATTENPFELMGPHLERLLEISEDEYVNVLRQCSQPVREAEVNRLLTLGHAQLAQRLMEKRTNT